jgi:hypothetical protein
MILLQKYYKNYQTMANCKTCSQPSKSCGCTPKPATICKTDCKETINADCVVYDISPNKSGISKFLQSQNGSKLTTILEKIDKKLTIPVDTCSRTKLNLTSEADASVVIAKLLTYICEQEDVKLKSSVTDKTNGFLFDKIKVGEGIKKELKKDSKGVETVQISIDYDKLREAFPCCGSDHATTISISGNAEVCGSNQTTLRATTQNNTHPIIWSNGVQGTAIQVGPGTYHATVGDVVSNTIIVTSTGSCNGCVPTSVYTCETSGSTISFKDSCNTVVENVMFIQPLVICDNNVQKIRTVSTGGSTAAVTFAITKVNNVNVVNPLYSASLDYTAIDNAVYEVTCKAVRFSTSCSITKTVLTTSCATSCSNLTGITIN